jgi:hypothetical protein
MSGLVRTNRKATDEDIVRLNSLGISLAKIGEVLDCHPTTITVRLKQLGVAPANTRRSFMQDVVASFNERQIEMLADKLGPTFSIKDYVRNLIAKDLIA